MKDIVRAYWLILNHGQPGEVYNVGSGQAVSIQHILDILLSFAETPIIVEADPDRMRPSDTPVFVSDCTRLKQATGWNPKSRWSRLCTIFLPTGANALANKSGDWHFHLA